MFLDSRLWQFTEGLRWRIAGAVSVGLLAALVGIGRLALLGWLLAQVFAGAPAESLILPVALVAVVMLLRGILEYWRNMIAHRTAACVQLALRERLFDKVVELGPAHFGLERTGDVLLAMVDGVEQLETYFGQYLPQLFVAALTPVIVFALIATLDLPVALVMFGFALITLIAPSVFQKWDSSNSMRRQKAYAAFAAEFLDAASYTHVNRWTNEIWERPAVKRGRMVNRSFGEPETQLHERHDASDFETKTQDKL